MVVGDMPSSAVVEVVPPSWLIISRTRSGQLVYDAGWRHRDADGVLRTMKRRLGPAWLVEDADGRFERRRGRVRPGFLDEPAAIVAKDRLVREVEQQLAEEAAAEYRAANTPPTFREIARGYLDWLGRVRGAKPATLADHRYLLAEPRTPHRRGAGVSAGHIMAALGDRPAAEVTTREVNELLDRVASTGVSPRTVNKHRQLVCSVYGYACHEATFGLERNPATAADRRPEPERARLDFLSPEEVEALARALAAGAHRDPAAPRVGEAEIEARGDDDRQDAELVRVAAYTGLRRGELVSLRWGDVDFGRRKIVVQRAVSASVEASSTKSRRAREVPLPDQAAGHSTACHSAATSRAPTTTSSSTASAAASMARRCGVASSALATPQGCARCASTTCATPTARCSSRAASTSPR
jgi:integrase